MFGYTAGTIKIICVFFAFTLFLRVIAEEVFEVLGGDGEWRIGGIEAMGFSSWDADDVDGGFGGRVFCEVFA